MSLPYTPEEEWMEKQLWKSVMHNTPPGKSLSEFNDNVRSGDDYKKLLNSILEHCVLTPKKVQEQKNNPAFTAIDVIRVVQAMVDMSCTTNVILISKQSYFQCRHCERKKMAMEDVGGGVWYQNTKEDIVHDSSCPVITANIILATKAKK